MFGGAPERCDFVDNNCNGQVDEGLWQEDPLARGPLTTGNLYPGNAGAPRGVRVGGDVFVAAASDGTSRGSVDLWRLDPASLVATHGPISLGASTTSWDTCYSGLNLFPGRRSVLGALAAGPDGGLLASGMVGSYSTASCCDSAVSPTATAIVTPVSGLSPGDGGVLASALIPGNGCNGGFNLYPRLVEVASAAWVPATGRYVLAWADATRVPGGQYQVLFSTFEPATGVLSMPRQVVQNGPTYAGSMLSSPTSVEGGVAVAAGPPGVLVVWQDSAPSASVRARFALFNDTLTQRLSGPTELVLPAYVTPSNPVAVRWDGSGFTVLLAGSSGTPSVLAGISPAGQVAWGPRTLPGSQVGANNGGIAPGSQPTFALVGNGLMTAQTRNNVFSVNWGPPGADGGLQSLDFDPGTPLVARSDPELVPLDDRRVLLVWADGNLRKTLLRCQE